MKSNTTDFFTAIRDGKREVVKQGLQNSISPNTRDQYDFPALCVAANSGQPEIVKLLLEYKADPLAPTSGGFLPSHIAAVKGDLEIIKILALYKINFSNPSPLDNWDELKLAAKLGRTNIVAFLLKQNVSHDAVDTNRQLAQETPHTNSNAALSTEIEEHGAEFSAFSLRRRSTY